ncbi:hypothetical protein A3C87_00190 [Candidatus Kaiserbacteria bacterium RIFCSPHIGHO2_02_FULL_49_34]|uniref:VTT domain-containing protein n=1 Tax=Candidatus Kaiserbacteria bacterium RIFCSPHIGHO2_02_FULL_49_34 TaxID=1798491 RepID=A0A1F6DJ03_9BACT|nr:MAG: hypothetical protein A3C87_00190 [Candidatus Kaiserbacteria bacterium RIFCSPHIGHO2_02_FULL_49_34]
MKEKLNHKNVGIGLAGVSFLESSFFPVIIDPFLLAAVALHRDKWVRYAIISSAFSVLGATFAYVVGVYAWGLWGAAILEWTNGAKAFSEIAVMLDRGAFIFTMIGAVTPVPYKLTALAGGVFQINFFAFLAASVIGRFARFFLVAYLGAVGKDVALKVLPHVTWRRAFIAGAVVGVALILVLR